MTTNALAKNTDTELWREIPDDYYAPSVHVTQDGRLGINVGGLVIVATLRQWHEWAMEFKRIEGADEAQGGLWRWHWRELGGWC